MRVAGMVLGLVSVLAMGASAQQPVIDAGPDWRTTSMAGFGYKGNLPRALLGVSAHVTFAQLRGFGLYVDYRATHESYRDEEFLTNITVRQAELEFGDDFVQARNHWRVANVAVLKPITAELALYAGGGLARHTVYREYFDTSMERGEFGHYRVEDDEDSGNRLNLTGGAMFRAGRHLAFHFGGETAPGGFTVGVSALLPLR